MISPALVDVVQCPDCGGAIRRTADGFVCARCGRVFDGHAGYLDLRPLAAFAEQTKYLDDALHADARHESVSPPLLGSKIRQDLLRQFLDLGPSDRAVDLGCGSGRALVWNAGAAGMIVGVDVSPFFAREALDRCDVVLGDLRRLPLRTGAFTKAWTLDVLEHLSPETLGAVLAEANRVLADDGALFVYTHVRKNGPLGGGVRLMNRLASLCERIGLIDLRQERLRKSDHLNPIADHDELERLVAARGFRIDRLVYYTPIIGAFVENVLVRIAEQRLVKRAARRDGPAATPDDAVREARASAKATIGRRGATYRGLVFLTWLMKLDVVLFGRVTSGPFFALLRKTTPTSG
ncbi:MAG: methyltransferase domain-containing protein [Vicinamibacterales bacterium]